MSRSSRLLLDDIRVAAEKIARYCKCLDRDAFFGNEMAYDAVMRNLEIIGEATRRLPESTRSQFAEIPWHQIAGLRNIIAHAYFGIDEDIIWDVITHHIPRLLNVLPK